MFEGFKKRARAFVDFSALTLVFLGLVLFSLRVPISPNGWANLPMAITVVQTAGLFLFLAGVQLIISQLLWPDIQFKRLLEQVYTDPKASAQVLAGLFLFMGLSLIAMVLWISSALGANITPG